jgi:hypothetical protein
MRPIAVICTDSCFRSFFRVGGEYKILEYLNDGGFIIEVGLLKCFVTEAQSKLYFKPVYEQTTPRQYVYCKKDVFVHFSASRDKIAYAGKTYEVVENKLSYPTSEHTIVVQLECGHRHTFCGAEIINEFFSYHPIPAVEIDEPVSFSFTDHLLYIRDMFSQSKS